MLTEIQITSDNLSVLSEPKPEEQKTFAASGADFYDYKCELVAVWKVWHEEDIKRDFFAT